MMTVLGNNVNITILVFIVTGDHIDYNPRDFIGHICPIKKDLIRRRRKF